MARLAWAARLPRVALTAVALTLASPAIATAATRYAAPTPSGTGDCSSPANACDLRSAVDGAPQGVNVVVLPGSYTIASALTPLGDGSITGQAGSRPLIRMTGSGSLGDWVGLNRSIVVSNLELESTGNQSPLTVGVNTTATHVIVDLNTSTGDLAAVTTTPGSKVADSLIRAAGTGAPVGVQVVPIPPGDGGSTTLLNDTVVATGRGSVGIEVTSGSVFLYPQGCEPFAADASLVNVIAHGAVGLATRAVNSPSANCAPLSVVSVAHSNYNGVLANNGQVTDDGHNQTGFALTSPAALFVSFPSNLHERPGAPTINAGSSTGLEATDLDGNPRVIGGRADIGAYEFIPPRPKPTCTLAPQSHQVSHAGVIALTIRCDQSARLTLSGRLYVWRRRQAGRRAFQVAAVHRSALKGQRTRADLVLSPRALTALKAASRAAIRLTLSATNANGTAATHRVVRGLLLRTSTPA